MVNLAFLGITLVTLSLYQSRTSVLISFLALELELELEEELAAVPPNSTRRVDAPAMPSSFMPRFF